MFSGLFVSRLSWTKNSKVSCWWGYRSVCSTQWWSRPTSPMTAHLESFASCVNASVSSGVSGFFAFHGCLPMPG